jgi:hypothetical protein
MNNNNNNNVHQHDSYDTTSDTGKPQVFDGYEWITIQQDKDGNNGEENNENNNIPQPPHPHQVPLPPLITNDSDDNQSTIFISIASFRGKMLYRGKKETPFLFFEKYVFVSCNDYYMFLFFMFVLLFFVFVSLLPCFCGCFGKLIWLWCDSYPYWFPCFVRFLFFKFKMMQTICPTTIQNIRVSTTLIKNNPIIVFCIIITMIWFHWVLLRNDRVVFCCCFCCLVQ